MGEIEVESNSEHGCITHGICEDCLKKQQEKIIEFKNKSKKEKDLNEDK